MAIKGDIGRGRGWWLCGTAIWPVDYGAETSAKASLQPVLDSVFDRGYKEKDGESAWSRGKKHAYVMEKVRAVENSHDQGREPKRKDARAKKEDGAREECWEKQDFSRRKERKREAAGSGGRVGISKDVSESEERNASAEESENKKNVEENPKDESETLERRGIIKKIVRR